MADHATDRKVTEPQGSLQRRIAEHQAQPISDVERAQFKKLKKAYARRFDGAKQSR